MDFGEEGFEGEYEKDVEPAGEEAPAENEAPAEGLPKHRPRQKNRREGTTTVSTVKKVPQRQCIGCGEMKNKRELIRVLKVLTT